jgi:hypothetical protein
MAVHSNRPKRPRLQGHLIVRHSRLQTVSENLVLRDSVSSAESLTGHLSSRE